MKNSHHDKVRPLMLTTRIILHSDNLLTSVICITSTILHIKIAPQIIDATTQTIKKVIDNTPPIFTPDRSFCLVNVVCLVFVTTFLKKFLLIVMFVCLYKKTPYYLSISTNSMVSHIKIRFQQFS